MLNNFACLCFNLSLESKVKEKFQPRNKAKGRGSSRKLYLRKKGVEEQMKMVRQNVPIDYIILVDFHCENFMATSGQVIKNSTMSHFGFGFREMVTLLIINPHHGQLRVHLAA